MKGYTYLSVFSQPATTISDSGEISGNTHLEGSMFSQHTMENLVTVQKEEERAGSVQ